MKNKNAALLEKECGVVNQKKRSGYEIFSFGAVTTDGVCSKESMRGGQHRNNFIVIDEVAGKKQEGKIKLAAAD